MCSIIELFQHNTPRLIYLGEIRNLKQKQNKALILAQFILHITLDNHIYIILLLPKFIELSWLKINAVRCVKFYVI